MRGQIGPAVEMIIHDSSHQRSDLDGCQKLQKCKRKYGFDSTLSLVFIRKHIRTMKKENNATIESGEGSYGG